jgi:excinuclease UvrABC ATPase subunit
LGIRTHRCRPRSLLRADHAEAMIGFIEVVERATALDVCKGMRYDRETLEVRYRGKNIAQILDLTVEAAAEFFKAVPTITRKLHTLLDVGLSYIKLG